MKTTSRYRDAHTTPMPAEVAAAYSVAPFYRTVHQSRILCYWERGEEFKSVRVVWASEQRRAFKNRKRTGRRTKREIQEVAALVALSEAAGASNL